MKDNPFLKQEFYLIQKSKDVARFWSMDFFRRYDDGWTTIINAEKYLTEDDPKRVMEYMTFDCKEPSIFKDAVIKHGVIIINE